MAQQGRTARQVGITAPPDIMEIFEREAGPGYGAKATLFRKMLLHWVATRPANRDSLVGQLTRERIRTADLEARLRRIRQALYEEGVL